MYRSLLKRGPKDAERNGMGRNVARTQTRNAFRVLVPSDWHAMWPQINFPCFSSRPVYIDLVHNFSGKIDRMLKRGLELLWRSNFNGNWSSFNGKMEMMLKHRLQAYI